MIVLGIDRAWPPSDSGWCVRSVRKTRWSNTASSPPRPGIPLSSRLLQISDDMEELIRTFHPDEMAVEELFFTKNITTGIAVAHGRGVILLSAERLGVPVFEYTPMR